MNEAFLESLAENIDEDELQKGFKKYIDKQVIPHLEDIRDRAKEDESNLEARESLMDLPEEMQNELFYTALHDLVYTLLLIRIKPIEGFRKAKEMLRDPYVLESLLLIFDHDHVDDAGSDELKDFVAKHIHWVGVALAPEMYSGRQRIAVLKQFGVPEDDAEDYEAAIDQMSIADLRESGGVLEKVE